MNPFRVLGATLISLVVYWVLFGLYWVVTPSPHNPNTTWGLVFIISPISIYLALKLTVRRRTKV